VTPQTSINVLQKMSIFHSHLGVFKNDDKAVRKLVFEAEHIFIDR